MEIIFFLALVSSNVKEIMMNLLYDLKYEFLGSMYEIGAETGRYYSINVPLREGITDDGSLDEKQIHLRS